MRSCDADQQVGIGTAHPLHLRVRHFQIQTGRLQSVQDHLHLNILFNKEKRILIDIIGIR